MKNSSSSKNDMVIFVTNVKKLKSEKEGVT